MGEEEFAELDKKHSLRRIFGEYEVYRASLPRSRWVVNKDGKWHTEQRA